MWIRRLIGYVDQSRVAQECAWHVNKTSLGIIWLYLHLLSFYKCIPCYRHFVFICKKKDGKEGHENTNAVE